jgi:hypothetical protein
LDILLYTIVLGVLFAVIILVIRKRHLVSAEGYCVALLGTYAAADYCSLLYDSAFNPTHLYLGYEEFAFRIYPTIIYSFGLLVLLAGLTVADPHPRRAPGTLSARDRKMAWWEGSGITVVGLVFIGVTIYLSGALHGNYFQRVDSWRNSVLDSGAFWYFGSSFAVFGLSIVAASMRHDKVKMNILFVIMAALALVFTSNKGGIEKPLLWSAITLYTFNRSRLRWLMRPSFVLSAVILCFIGLGIKDMFVGQSKNPFQYDLSSAAEAADKSTQLAVGALNGRWSDQGAYRGFCEFINSIPDNQFRFDGFVVGGYAVIAWIPRMVWHNKPVQPFQGLGNLVHPDRHVYATETPSAGLVGTAMADSGMWSLCIYLFLVGLLLGLFRRYMTQNTSTYILYLLFIILGGLSAESGIISLTYTVLLALGVGAPVAFLAHAWSKPANTFAGLYITPPPAATHLRRAEWHGR